MANFIKDRWNKDNFWNLVFFVGIVLSTGIAEFILGFTPKLGLILLILSITVVPYFLAKPNSVTYKDKNFLSKYGRNLNSNISKHIVLVIMLTIPFTVQS